MGVYICVLARLCGCTRVRGADCTSLVRISSRTPGRSSSRTRSASYFWAKLLDCARALAWSGCDATHTLGRMQDPSDRFGLSGGRQARVRIREVWWLRWRFVKGERRGVGGGGTSSRSIHSWQNFSVAACGRGARFHPSDPGITTARTRARTCARTNPFTHIRTRALVPPSH